MSIKILVPVDGSRNSNFVVPRVVQEFQRNPALEIHLLNVQPRFPANIACFASKKNREAFHRARAGKSLLPITTALDGFQVPYSLHVAVGDEGVAIARTAHRLGCDHIVMGTARKNPLTRLVENSVTNKVLERTTVPVEVIAGDAESRWECYGIPAALSALLTLLLVATAD